MARDATYFLLFFGTTESLGYIRETFFTLLELHGLRFHQESVTLFVYPQYDLGHSAYYTRFGGRRASINELIEAMSYVFAAEGNNLIIEECRSSRGFSRQLSTVRIPYLALRRRSRRR